MKTRSHGSLVKDSLWRPLVLIEPHHQGFIVQPGSNVDPIALSPGWHWHWPLLTTIRSVSLEPHNYCIGSAGYTTDQSLGDEPIIAATKDLSLVSVEAELQLQVMADAPIQIVSRLNPRSINRLIRPVIRQSIRLTLANYPSQKLQPSASLDRQIAALLAPTLADQAIALRSLQVTIINRFNPLKPTPPAAS
jgi:hypothetical protein